MNHIIASSGSRQVDFWERLEYQIRMKSTRKAIAELAGVAPNTFSTWKARGTFPDGAVLAKIARALNVTVEFLVSGEDDRDQWLLDNEDFLANLRMLPKEELESIKASVAARLPHPELLASHRTLLRKFMEVPNATPEPQRSAYWRECARWGLISSSRAEEFTTVPPLAPAQGQGKEY